MGIERHLANSPRSRRLASKMGTKSYRHAFVESHTRQFLARQMRAFRADLSQKEFGEQIERRQTVISRLENPNYSGWNLQTLFDVARRRDVAVIVRFVDFQTFLKFSADASETAAAPSSYDQSAVEHVASEDEAHD